MKRMVLNGCLVLLSLLVLAGLGEGLLRLAQHGGWLAPISGQSMARAQTPNAHLNARMKRSDNDKLFLEFDIRDPNINSAGFRGGEISVEKTPGTVRIALLGDSVAYGYSVPLDHTFAHLLEADLQQDAAVEILNFAVSGYDSTAQAELLKTRVWQYQPDVLLLAYVLNDPVPPRVMVENVGAAMRSIARLNAWGQKSQLLAGVYWLWLEAWQNLGGRGDLYRGFYDSDIYWQPVVEALTIMKAEADQRNVPLLVTVFPLLRDFPNYRFGYAHDKIGQLLEELNLPFLDLKPAFAVSDYRQFQLIPQDDTHPNAEGHRLAADALLPFVRPWVQRYPASSK